MTAIENDARAIFLAALERAPEEWPAFVENACRENTAARARVEQLLYAHQAMGSIHGGRGDAPPPTLDQPIAERPGTVLGHYKLLEQIGEGGFGVVFMAEQQEPVRRKVALKVLKPGMDTRQVVARFEAERQALALMDHPNIAHVFDGGSTDTGRPYFVMELVRGVPITEFCDQACLGIRQRLQLVVDVCQAVQHAHQKGIIHRDIKPTNVLVTLHDGTPVVKVIDFGIAKAMGQQLTEKTLFTNFAQMIGTPLYMSPEQAEMSGLDVDTRSDIYAIGVLFYELLTGTTPFESERLSKVGCDEMRRIIREEEPPKPSARISTVGKVATTAFQTRQGDARKLSRLFRGELDWIVMKCLEKDRNRRYETANGLAMDVQRYLRDEPVLACTPSARYRVGKFARRHKAGIAIGGLCLLLIVLVGGGVGWMLRDRSARQSRAEGNAVGIINAAAPQLQQGQPGDPALAAAALHVRALLDSDALGSVMRQRAQQFLREVRILDELDEIRLRQAESKDGHMFDRAGADKRYAAAFLAYGLDVATLEPAQAAARVRESPIRETLLAGLDAWLQFEPANSGLRDNLRAVADGADDSAWRRSVREAVLANDSNRLKSLASDLATQEQSQDVLARLGSRLQMAGLREEAEAVLRHGQARYPGDFWINYYLGHLLLFDSPQRPDEAIGYLRAAAAIRPRSAEARSILGIPLHFKGDYDAAIACYQQAIALDPRFAAAHRNVGNALRAKGRVDEAIAEFREALRIRPDFLEARHDLDFALLELTFRNGALHRGAFADTDKGEVQFAKMIESRPDDVWPYYWRALWRVSAGDVCGYRSDCAALLDRFGHCDDPEIMFRLAWAAVLHPQAVDDPNRPIALAEAAVRRAPDSDHVAHTLGPALYRAGRFADAVARLNEVHAAWEQAGTKPNEYSPAYTWFFLAMAHQQLGHAEEARRWLDKAVAWAEQEIKSEGVVWNRRLTLELLRREAESVMNGAPDAPPVTEMEETTGKE